MPQSPGGLKRKLAEPEPQPAAAPFFTAGSLIQLAGGGVRRVEELTEEDFRASAELSGELQLEPATVTGLQEVAGRAQVTFSLGQGETATLAVR